MMTRFSGFTSVTLCEEQCALGDGSSTFSRRLVLNWSCCRYLGDGRFFHTRLRCIFLMDGHRCSPHDSACTDPRFPLPDPT